MCGDFNAEPNEPIYSTIISNNMLKLSSGYADIMGDVNQPINQTNQMNGDSEAVENGTTEDTTTDGESKSRAQQLASREPPFTTWKIREEGEVCHTIDYIFYSMDKLKVILHRNRLHILWLILTNFVFGVSLQIKNCLQFPHDTDIGKNRTPSFRYPSDHFSLLCDFEFMDNQHVEHWGNPQPKFQRGTHWTTST